MSALLGFASLRGRSAFWLAALGIFAAAAVAGWNAAERITPDLIRVDLQERLEAMLGTPVRVKSVRIALGLRIHVIGEGIEAYPAPEGPALRVERVVAEVRPFAHLTGQRRLRRLALEGATLRVSRDASGRWTPSALASLLARRGPAEPEAPKGLHHPDEILSPLIVLEAGARRLLESDLPADRFELHAGRLEWRTRGPRARATPVPETSEVAWEGIALEMRRRPLLGETVLHVAARLADRRAERGSVEMEGSLSRDGSIRVAVAATELDLAAATATASAVVPALELEGIARGVVVFEAPTPGSGRLEVDLVGRDIRGAAPGFEPGLGPFSAPRVELGGVLEIDPQRVRLRAGRLRSERLALRLEGLVERPLRPDSLGELSLGLEGARLDELRTLLAWLPEVEREEAFGVLANLESGRVHRLEVGGAAPLGGWQEFLAGRAAHMPRDFALLAELQGVRLRAGEDPIEELEGRVAWKADRLEVSGLRARLGGRALPALDLEVDGISSFFDTDPEQRRLRTSAPPLAGLAALWQDLRPEDPDEPGRMPVALGLAIERLEHPMFLWPIEGLTAEITPIEQGVRVEARDGTWGGVPIELAADWLFLPEERVVARVVAGREEAEEPAAVPAPASAIGSTPAPDAWARGRLSLGPVDESRWKQRGATADFAAYGSRLFLSDARLDLAPHGRGVANARIDLSRAGVAPFQVSFEIFDADLPTLGASVRLPPEIASGRVDVAGSLAGSFDPGAPLSRSLEGLIDADARSGTLRKEVPAAMALALASGVLAPIGKRELVRYERMRSLLELDRGRLATNELTFDGPDARAFARGEVGIGPEPHPVDVDVVLFLFRPVDWVLDKIPIVNYLLLGPNRNLLAAHYELSGTWEEPDVRLVPLESLKSGPGTLVFERLPSIFERGLEALGGLIGRDRVARPEPAPPPVEEAPPPRES